MKGSGGEKPEARRRPRTPGETRGDKRPASTPGAFACGYPSAMRSATHNLTIMT